LKDFNVHSPTWDPNCPEDLSGEELDDWAITGDLVVLNDGSPTRISSRGVATAPDVTFVLSAWEEYLIWHTSINIMARTTSPLSSKSAVVFTPANLEKGYILLQES